MVWGSELEQLPAGPQPSQLLEHLHPGRGVSKWSCLFLDFLPHTLWPAHLGPSQCACGSSYSSATPVQTAKSALKVGEQLGKNRVSQGKQCLLALGHHHARCGRS